MNTLNNLKNQFGQVLSREDLKNVVGGQVALGSYCSLYCCDGEGNCSSVGVQVPGPEEGGGCTSNEQCQDHGGGPLGYYCNPGHYLAALCKG